MVMGYCRGNLALTHYCTAYNTPEPEKGLSPLLGWGWSWEWIMIG